MPFEPGLEENGFLNMLQVKPSDLDFLADRCTKVNENILFCKILYHFHIVKTFQPQQNIIDNLMF